MKPDRGRKVRCIRFHAASSSVPLIRCIPSILSKNRALMLIIRIVASMHDSWRHFHRSSGTTHMRFTALTPLIGELERMPRRSVNRAMNHLPDCHRKERSDVAIHLGFFVDCRSREGFSQ
jgi:hypothetical protein